MTPYMYRMPRRASVRATTMYPLPNASSSGAPANSKPSVRSQARLRARHNHVPVAQRLIIWRACKFKALSQMTGAPACVPQPCTRCPAPHHLARLQIQSPQSDLRRAGVRATTMCPLPSASSSGAPASSKPSVRSQARRRARHNHVPVAQRLIIWRACKFKALSQISGAPACAPQPCARCPAPHHLARLQAQSPQSDLRRASVRAANMCPLPSASSTGAPANSKPSVRSQARQRACHKHVPVAQRLIIWGACKFKALSQMTGAPACVPQPCTRCPAPHRLARLL